MNPNPRLPRRARVLQLSYACSPAKGSEPGVGWNRAVQAARYSDVWVICEGNEFGEVIRRRQSGSDAVSGLHFEFVPKTPCEEALSRLPGLYYLGYNLWHRRAFRLAQSMHRAISFDLVHQVNMCGFREPGYLWRLDAPFVWGPVGGTQNYPWRFLSQADWLGGIGEVVRSVSNELQLRFSPRVRQAAAKAALVMTANSTNQADFERARIAKPVQLLETGLGSVDAEIPVERKPNDPLKILWVGEFRTWKALPLLLRALGRCRSELDFELRIVGAGSLESSWRREAERLEIADRCTWLGWRPRHELLTQYQWADVLPFTSLRDTSGNVVLEAMAAGVPVICLDHQGVRDLVTHECGVKIPVSRPRRVVDAIHHSLLTLARQPAQHIELRRGAVRRAEEFLWSRQGDRMQQMYRDILGEGFCWSPREETAKASPAATTESGPAASVELPVTVPLANSLEAVT